MKRENRAPSHRLCWRKRGRDFLYLKKKSYSGSPWQGRKVETTEQKEDESNSAWRNNDPSKKQTRLSVFLSLPFSAVMPPPDSMHLSSALNIQAGSWVSSEQLQNHKLNSSKHIPICSSQTSCPLPSQIAPQTFRLKCRSLDSVEIRCRSAQDSLTKPENWSSQGSFPRETGKK